MAFSSCFCHSPLGLKSIKPCGTLGKGQKVPFPSRSNGAELCNQRRVNLIRDWSFIRGSRIVVKPKVMRLVPHQKASQIHASWLSGSELASSAFTLGTTAVLPFYTLMVLAPNSELHQILYLLSSESSDSLPAPTLYWVLTSAVHVPDSFSLNAKMQTKRSVESSVPYAVLGVVYAYIVYLSWTSETVGLLFASKYLLPELTSITKMFSSEMTLASAWIHLLVVDLFAARHVFLDGLENKIETRHSITLCLFCCPVGIVTHVITKAVSKTAGKSKH